MNVVYRKPVVAKKLPANAVRVKRVRDPESGKLVTVRTIEMTSEHFGDAFTEVFKKNVAKARRENKRVLGVADVEPRNSAK
jgi:hypothetical protein